MDVTLQDQTFTEELENKSSEKYQNLSATFVKEVIWIRGSVLEFMLFFFRSFVRSLARLFIRSFIHSGHRSRWRRFLNIMRLVLKSFFCLFVFQLTKIYINETGFVRVEVLGFR